jgi:hypothetical protein
MAKPRPVAVAARCRAAILPLAFRLIALFLLLRCHIDLSDCSFRLYLQQQELLSPTAAAAAQTSKLQLGLLSALLVT